MSLVGKTVRVDIAVLGADHPDVDTQDSLAAAQDTIRSLQIELDERTRERDDARLCAERVDREMVELRDRLRDAEGQDLPDDPVDSDSPAGLHVVSMSDRRDADRLREINARLIRAIDATAAMVVDDDAGAMGRMIAADQLGELTRMLRDLEEYDIHAASARETFLAKIERRLGVVPSK